MILIKTLRIFVMKQKYTILIKRKRVTKAEKCIGYACFRLQAHCIVYWIYSFFFLKMAKIKAIKEEIENNKKVWINSL